ncbi:hypothetical protein CEP54_006216 [Fusarium duplospermum]|uniref:Uncharacterized protein n=1 Tax=Fusarium duplospermum TaxID=1325734 RepID=A0A428Q877_9HYPO|nr:hypothetical protein CEP54_006216 [Fusarium duplospermum]
MGTRPRCWTDIGSKLPSTRDPPGTQNGLPGPVTPLQARPSPSLLPWMEPRPGQDGQDETPSTVDASWLAGCNTTTGTVSHVPLPVLSLQPRTNSLLLLLLTKTYIYCLFPSGGELVHPGNR